MVRRSLAYVVVVACTSAATLSVGHAQTRAVIELFTSQGCSSCPAADRLIGELSKDPSLISISVPIDYWDYLGWKDTLADPLHTARQRAYSKVRGDREVYTPQVVVNGSYQALGSDKAAIDHMIAKSRQNPAAVSLPLNVSISGGRLTVTLPEAGLTRPPAEVVVVGLARAITVAIKRGENKGKSITYHNVARRWTKLESADGKLWTVPLDQIEAEGVTAAAVMVQDGTLEHPSLILGAAMAALH